MKIPSSTRLPLFHFMKVILWQNLNQIEQYLGGAIMYKVSWLPLKTKDKVSFTL